jgi:hypothetical protein
MHDLLRRQGATGVAAHAVRHDRQGNARTFRMWQYGNTVLLFLTISLVLRGARIYD